LNRPEHLFFPRQTERKLRDLGRGDADLQQECESRDGRNQVLHRQNLNAR
jgi:hypothetical protein